MDEIVKTTKKLRFQVKNKSSALNGYLMIKQRKKEVYRNHKHMATNSINSV